MTKAADEGIQGSALRERLLLPWSVAPQLGFSGLQGLTVIGKDGSSNYDDQANQSHDHRLEGHLLLIHGLLDDNVPPANTLLVVQALVEAHKDLELLLLPEARHGYGSGEGGTYGTRRRWDYFVENHDRKSGVEGRGRSVRG